MALVEVEYRELLDGDGEVVGYVDPEGFAHEFALDDSDPDLFLLDRVDEMDKTRSAGDRLLVPEYALKMLDDEGDNGDDE